MNLYNIEKMKFLSNMNIYGGLVGWIIAVTISLSQYRHITALRCAFISAWPFCSNATTGGQIALQVATVSVYIGLLIWGGVVASRLFEGTTLSGLSKRSIYFLIGVSLLGAFLLVPFASSDLEYYFSAGKALDAGQNLYATQWHLQNHFIDPVYDTQAGEIMYGPIMLPILTAFYRMSAGNIILFTLLWKLFMVAVFIACGYLVYRLIRMRVPDIDSKSLLLLWATQPLLLFEWIGNGHFDGLWIVSVLLAFLFAQRKQWWLVFPVLTLGVWIKFIPLLVAPWFVLWWWQEANRENWKSSISQLIGGGFISALLTYIVWKPYWAGTGVFKAIMLQSKWAVASIFSTIYYSLLPVFQMALGGDRAHWLLTRLVQGTLLIAAVYLLYPYIKAAMRIVLKREILSVRGYQAAVFISLLAYLLVWQKSFWPWYFTWLIPLGMVAFAGTENMFWKKIGAWIGTAPLLFYIPWMWAKGNADGLWFYGYVVLVVMAYPLWQLIQWRKADYV